MASAGVALREPNLPGLLKDFGEIPNCRILAAHLRRGSLSEPSEPRHGRFGVR